MLGDTELGAIAVTGLLWVAALAALLLRRTRAGWLVAAAVLASIATLAVLRAGIGHRA